MEENKTQIQKEHQAYIKSITEDPKYWLYAEGFDGKTIARVDLNKKDLKLFLKGKAEFPFLKTLRILTIVNSAGNSITYQEAKEMLEKEVEDEIKK